MFLSVIATRTPRIGVYTFHVFTRQSGLCTSADSDASEASEQKELRPFDDVKQRRALVRRLANKKASELLQDDDAPVTDIENPYKKAQPRCVLCTHDVQLDWKNVRLLTQFVSPHTGRLYERDVTGLCCYMHERVQRAVIIAQRCGVMPKKHKWPKYVRDPMLFDSFRTHELNKLSQE